MTLFPWQLKGEVVEIDPTEARKIAEQRLAQEMEEEMAARKAKRLRALAAKKLEGSYNG
tara:strand:+ start:609 stop:785 length:177 start_codon:yes stop_codon:yes gene_type:complete